MPRAGRLRTREEGAYRRPWTTKEVAFLEWNVTRMTLQAISQELGRTESSVERRLRDLGLKAKPKPKPKAERIARERWDPTLEELEKVNQLHLADLKRAGHTWWHRYTSLEADAFSPRSPASTFAHASCTGSPAAMCAE